MSGTGANGSSPTVDAGGAAAAVTEGQARPKFLQPNFARLPAHLKQLKNWVLWVPIWTGSKWTKRPIQTSGYGASTTNPKHWCCFDAVKEAYERAVERGYVEFRDRSKPTRQVPIGGVGYVFDGEPGEDGLVFAGVDFDKVITDGRIASFAEERIKRLGSYTERSVSGDGLHVILKARLLPAGVKHGGTELYSSGRFFTMTGRAPIGAQIIAAPEEFAALAEDLRAQSTSTGKDKDNPPQGNRQQTTDAETSTWFGKLPIKQRSEVIKYAARCIARNSKHFELSANGGDYQVYLKLALAIARSGVPDAENVFVEAASIAKDADPEEKLRTFFQDCEHAPERPQGVTLGTLFHYASQCGANFGQWKQLVAEADPDVAMFVPGNEEDCRSKLAHVVAADPCTYALGDPAGPLVILRVPDKEDLPAETRWEGDLPGTTLATAADVMERAERITWMKKGQWGPYRIRPPRDFISDYLTQLRGRYGARPLRGIVRVPRIDDSGKIYFNSG